MACLILDGGLGSSLEKVGIPINTPLWSAQLLTSSEGREALAKVHRDFLLAGADIITTASYQASIPGFTATGMSREKAIECIHSATRLGLEVRDAVWNDHKQSWQSEERIEPMVAASIGCFGATLGNGSEYTGDYGKHTYNDVVRSVSERLEILLSGPTPDIIAFETIPCLMEARAIGTVLRSQPPLPVPVWVTFACRDDRSVSSGDSIEECVRAVLGVQGTQNDNNDNDQEKRSSESRATGVCAVGVNCTARGHCAGLMRRISKVIMNSTSHTLVLSPPFFRPPSSNPLQHHSQQGVCLVVYPNSGEAWDPNTKTWKTGDGSHPRQWDQLCWEWWATGARVIGGCCRTTSRDVAAIRKCML